MRFTACQGCGSKDRELTPRGPFILCTYCYRALRPAFERGEYHAALAIRERARRLAPAGTLVPDSAQLAVLKERERSACQG